MFLFCSQQYGSGCGPWFSGLFLARLSLLSPWQDGGQCDVLIICTGDEASTWELVFRKLPAYAVFSYVGQFLGSASFCSCRLYPLIEGLCSLVMPQPHGQYFDCLAVDQWPSELFWSRLFSLSPRILGTSISICTGDGTRCRRLGFCRRLAVSAARFSIIGHGSWC